MAALDYAQRSDIRLSVDSTRRRFQKMCRLQRLWTQQRFSAIQREKILASYSNDHQTLHPTSAGKRKAKELLRLA